MNAYIITATEEHDCSRRGCPKGGRILVGEKAVKTPPSPRDVKPHYYHAETCWPPTKGGRK